MNRWFSSVTAFSSVQWLFFIFANTFIIPISVGTAFELPADTIAMMVRSSLIFTGLAGILQGWIGHRLPIMEGHAGLTWGVILNLALSASSLGMSFTEIGGGLATGFLLAGFVVVLLGVFNLVGLVQKVLTPMVVTVNLFLLTFQLIFVFFKGMMKVTEEGTIDVPITLLSVGLVIFVSLLKIKGNQLVSNFNILIGIVVGWILFVLLFPDEQVASVSSGFAFSLFPLGRPNLEFGLIAVAFLAGMFNLTFTIASVYTTASLLKEKAEEKQLRKSFFLTGIYGMVAALFGLIPTTPYASTVGFLESTRIFRREPFFIAGWMMVLMGLIPPLGDFLSTMPVTVGNAVLFVAYLQMFGTAYNSLKGELFTSFTIFRLAGPVLLGVSIMNTSPALFTSFPVLLQPFLTNGLIMGVFLSIVIEKLINWEKFAN